MPRTQVWVASLTQVGLEARTPEEMGERMLARMAETRPLQPDIICLPEAFLGANLAGGRVPLEDLAEEPLTGLSAPFAEYAREHGCYVICPTYTVEAGRCYNAAVVIDRQGRYVGEYRKINPTLGELERGITPGPLDPPAFATDFGTIGVQICWDVNWHDNWRRLRAKGADLVFWSSAFSGGEMLNALAATYKYHVVSSTRNTHPSKFVDPLGDDLLATGRAAEWICAPLNLNVAVVQTVVHIRRLEAARQKYGRLLRVRVKHVEAYALVESLSEDLPVHDVLAEFDIPTSAEFLAENTRRQDAARGA